MISFYTCTRCVVRAVAKRENLMIIRDNFYSA